MKHFVYSAFVFKLKINANYLWYIFWITFCVVTLPRQLAYDRRLFRKQ